MKITNAILKYYFRIGYAKEKKNHILLKYGYLLFSVNGNFITWLNINAAFYSLLQEKYI